jgi:NTE family protein
MAVLGVCLVCASSIGVAADSAPASIEPDRPRIGLVLGGGGARGAAHIGVLRELERRRVPIDAIAGTSMGAIVGGLYASGHTPAELEALVDRIDWADAFIDASPRRDLTFRRKRDDADYPANIELGVREGSLQAPKGLIQGQKLQGILREQLLHVSRVRDFDDLPTPFRAVASDLATGDPYVLANGDLALAVSASMAAPGIFAPVTVDGRILVDGGLTGNVPVEVIRSMDVDIIIAVDVEFPLYPPEELQSALAITEQMLTILIRQETLRQLSSLTGDDILIRPDIGEYASTDFENIGDVIDPGRAAAAEAGDQLDRFALPEAAFADFLAARQIDRDTSETLDFVRVVDDGPLSSAVLLDRLQTAPGDPIDTAILADDVSRLYGLSYYEHVGYRLVHENDETGVEFQTRAKSWGPNFLRFGLTLEDDFEGATAFNVAARLTATGLNSRGAEWRNDLQIGTNPELGSEFYQPLDFDSRYFVAPSIDLEQRNIQAFADDELVGRYRVSEGTLGLDFGRALGRWGELRAGMFRGAGEARVKVGDPTLPNTDFDRGGAQITFDADTLDDAQIPTHGLRARIEWRMSRPGMGADASFDTVSARFSNNWSFGNDDRNTLQLGLEYATTSGSDSQVQDYFPLGGFLRLSGLARGEISGPHAGLARLVYYRRVGNGNGSLLDMPLYFGGSLEAGNAWLDRSDIGFDDLIANGSLFAGLDTFFGQLYLGAGFSENGDTNFYLFLGNTGF